MRLILWGIVLALVATSPWTIRSEIGILAWFGVPVMAAAALALTSPANRRRDGWWIIGGAGSLALLFAFSTLAVHNDWSVRLFGMVLSAWGGIGMLSLLVGGWLLFWRMREDILRVQSWLAVVILMIGVSPAIYGLWILSQW